MKLQFLIGTLILSMILIAGCNQQGPIIVGNDSDEHGCKASAGYSWCEDRQKCIRSWEENCTGCSTCPQLSPPAPGFCQGGTIVSGEKNECGCQGPPKCIRACTEEAKLCPGGSAVGRNGSNNCEFDPCPSTGMPNPASKFCQAQGGESKIITNADDSQSGVCVLPYGIECDEWKYFRGECPASVTCTAEQKAAEICTMEYMPTCGDDGVTYGNKCTACGSKNIDSYVPGECPAKTYVTRDLEQCKVIRYVCIKGKAAFSDEFGCGCEPETTCGNGVCDAGEADQCPACYYSTPPCLAPCTAGTCSEDCAPTDGKLKATDCQNPRTQACTKEYMPVCGWFNTSIQCIKYPCAANYGNKCTACADYKVAYWTDERCPNTSDGSEGNTEPGSPGSGNTESTGIANPASVYCVEHGGTLDIRDDVENEGQIGLCILPGGAECEEWAYFRGECQ